MDSSRNKIRGAAKLDEANGTHSSRKNAFTQKASKQNTRRVPSLTRCGKRRRINFQPISSNVKQPQKPNHRSEINSKSTEPAIASQCQVKAFSHRFSARRPCVVCVKSRVHQRTREALSSAAPKFCKNSPIRSNLATRPSKLPKPKKSPIQKGVTCVNPIIS